MRTTRTCARPLFDNYLLSNAIFDFGLLACGLRGRNHHSLWFEVEISADAFDSFARLAGALSLLALYKIGRGSGGHRARQRVRAEHIAACAPSRGSAPEPGPAPEPRRNGLRLHSIVAGAWIALSLLLLGYATIEGELAIADLDGLELVRTYAGSIESP